MTNLSQKISMMPAIFVCAVLLLLIWFLSTEFYKEYRRGSTEEKIAISSRMLQLASRAVEQHKRDYGHLPVPDANGRISGDDFLVQLQSSARGRKSYPLDPFDSKEAGSPTIRVPYKERVLHLSGKPVRLYVLGDTFAVASNGPDLDQDFGEAALKGNLGSYINFKYDPTNGIVSNGDIFNVY